MFVSTSLRPFSVALIVVTAVATSACSGGAKKPAASSATGGNSSNATNANDAFNQNEQNPPSPPQNPVSPQGPNTNCAPTGSTVALLNSNNGYSLALDDSSGTAAAPATPPTPQPVNSSAGCANPVTPIAQQPAPAPPPGPIAGSPSPNPPGPTAPAPAPTPPAGPSFPTIPANPPSPSPTFTGATLESCQAKNLSWVPQQGGSAACGDPLVSWCCTDTQVYAQFPTMSAQLQSAFATYEGQGQKLYHCAFANGKYTFLFFKASAGGYNFANVTMTQVNAAAPNAAACALPTSAQLGITSSN